MLFPAEQEGFEMRKLTALILSAALLIPAVPAYAAYDYAAMTTELYGLINQCNNLGIPTDYETVSCKVIERFEKYMNGDAQSGVSADILGYNDAQIKRLYNETKENLNAYISGTKYPREVSRAKMSRVSQNGANLSDGGNPVYSLGYGHFSLAQKDIPEFQNFGVSNIQLEIGPEYVKNEEAYWRESSGGNPQTTVKTSAAFKRSGGSSLYVKNTTEEVRNVYYMFSQTVDCKPDTTYKFGCYSYITAMESYTNYVSLNGTGAQGRKLFKKSASWTDTGATYTTEPDREQLQFTISVSGIVTAYFDDCYLYELDADGNIVSDNLLKNPGFEDGRSYANSFRYVTDALETAEKSNVAVNLLLSPHYFPADVSGVQYNQSASGFLKYNINAPEAKAVLENYLRTLLPELKGYKALTGIILANEPVFKTTDYPDFYNPLFREYLKDIHGTVSALNSAYGKSYGDFSEINMPNDVTAYDALSYDWIEFNDKMMAEWHRWLGETVHKYLPDIPVSTKMMGIIEGSGEELSDRLYLTRGTDIDLLGEAADWAGNDSYDVIGNPDTYYRTMFLYDYQYSAVGKPIYNSEDHLIADGDAEFSEKQRLHWGNSLWQGAIHGRSMSSIWVWERSHDSTSPIYNSVLARPDIVAETGKRSLDLAALGSEIAAVGQLNYDVALWYSKPSRLYDAGFSKRMMNTYKALLSIGKKPGIVSDKSIGKLNNYKVLIIPGAQYCTKDALAAVNDFIGKGGKVIYSDGAFSRDEYKKALSNFNIVSNGYLYSPSGKVSDIAKTLLDYLNGFGLARVMLKTASGEIPENIDWTYCIDGSRLLINASNSVCDSVQNAEVYLDGKKITGMRELITESEVRDSIVLSGYKPVLLEKKFAYGENFVKTISADKNAIRWTYENGESNTANVYKVLKNGMLDFLQCVTGHSYVYTDNGSYVVKAISAGREENSGKMITAGEQLPFSVEIADAVPAEKSVLCDIKLTNNLDYYATCVLMIRVKNSAGEIIGSASHKPVMKAGAQTDVRISVSASEIPYETEVAALDSYNGNEMSNTVTRVFETK